MLFFSIVGVDDYQKVSENIKILVGSGFFTFSNPHLPKKNPFFSANFFFL